MTGWVQLMRVLSLFYAEWITPQAGTKRCYICNQQASNSNLLSLYRSIGDTLFTPHRRGAFKGSEGLGCLTLRECYNLSFPSWFYSLIRASVVTDSTAQATCRTDDIY